MKKTLAGVLTLMLVLSMGTTVFAAGSTDSEGAVLEAQKEKVESIQYTENGQEQALSYGVVTTDELSEANDKAKSVSEEAEILGMVDVVAPSGVDASKGITLTITASGVKAGDNIRILHKKADGTWETLIPSQVMTGKVIVTLGSLSPIAIVRYPSNVNVDGDNNVNADPTTPDTNISEGGDSTVDSSNSANPTINQNVTVNQNVTSGTGASSATSPKTGASFPVLPAIAVLAIMGIAICGKKARKLS